MDQPSSADESGITLRIKFKSESVDHFIARYGADVSPGGIFIRTRNPLGVGTTLRFEFGLADGQALLMGNGTVVWVREPDQARAGVVPGMGVRFDKLSPESQNVLGTILAGKTGKEGSGAARLSAAYAVVGPASSEPDAAAASRPTPASMPNVGGTSPEGAPATSDPWQSDRTEIASMPPSFSVDGRRNSEELSLSGAEPMDFGAARGTPPSSSPVLAPRKQTPALGSDLPGLSKPAPAAREGAGNGTAPQMRRNSPAGGVGATPISGPGPTSPGPTSPGRSLTPGLGVPAAPPVGLGHAHASSPRHAVEVAPVGGPAPEENITDPFNRPGVPATTTPIAPPGRGKMLLVIGVAAMVTAALGFFVLQGKLADRPATQAPSSPTVVTAPIEPPKPTPPPQAAPTPTPPAAPAPAPAPAPAAAAPSAAPSQAATPTPKAPKPAAPKVARPVRRPPVAAAEPAAEPAEAATDDASGAVEEYWLRVRSTPPGAEVLIDGQVEGKTPFERRLLDPTRPYALTLRKSGFETHEQMLSASDEWVKKGNKRTLTVAAKLGKIKGAVPEPANDKPADPAPVENPPATP